MRRFLATISFCLIAQVSHAASLEDALMSNEELSSSLAAILKMPKDELASLTSYLGTCNAASATDDPSASFQCERERATHRYRYAQKRPLDRLMFAVEVATKLTKNNARQPAATQKDLTKIADRLVFVDGAIGDACAERYRRLQAAN